MAFVCVFQLQTPSDLVLYQPGNREEGINHLVCHSIDLVGLLPYFIAFHPTAQTRVALS